MLEGLGFFGFSACRVEMYSVKDSGSWRGADFLSLGCFRFWLFRV